MDDLKCLARLLIAICKAQDEAIIDLSLFSEATLNMKDTRRDRLAVRLEKEGYIDGLILANARNKTRVLWEKSRPELTIKGMTQMEENETLKKQLFEEEKHELL